MMRLLAMVGALLVLAVPLRAGDSDSGWRMTQAVGEVSVSNASGLTLVAVKPNDPLPVEAVVSTGTTGRVVLVRGNETVILAPQTRITLPKSGNPDRTILLQSAGRALFQIGKRPVAHFEVKTPYLAAVVKGTTFEVDVAAEADAVDVTEGAVEVTNIGSNGMTLVRGGNRIRIDKNGGSQAGRTQGPSVSAVPSAATLAPSTPLTPAVVTEPANGSINPEETSAGLVEVETPANKEREQRSEADASNASNLNVPAPRDVASVNPRQPAEISTGTKSEVGKDSTKPAEEASADTGSDTGKKEPIERGRTEEAPGHSGEDIRPIPDVSEPKEHGRSEEAPGHADKGPDKCPDSPPGQEEKAKDPKPEKPGKGKSKT